MLNKYKFITIMEEKFCKVVMYKICVSNQFYLYESNIRMNNQMINLSTYVEFNVFCHFERLWVNVMNVITKYWMCFVGEHL
jgi:hypothetical protein